MRRRQATKCVMRAFQRGGPRYPYATWQRVLRWMVRAQVRYDITTKQWGRLDAEERQPNAATPPQEGALT